MSFTFYNSKELTEKIRSIQAFKSIVAPYKKCEEGFGRPDYTSRYYTEDVPYGTCIIQQYARKVGISTPVIDMLVSKIIEVSRINAFCIVNLKI